MRHTLHPARPAKRFIAHAEGQRPRVIPDLDPTCRAIGNLTKELTDELAAAKARHPSSRRTTQRPVTATAGR